MIQTLECSLCGWKSPQKKFKYKEINRRFESAFQIRCPRNCCREQFDHSIPKGYICTTWYEYTGWQTVEKIPKLISIDDARSMYRAKMLENTGRQMLQDNSIESKNT